MSVVDTTLVLGVLLLLSSCKVIIWDWVNASLMSRHCVILPPLITTSSFTMEAALNNLTATGGGDCPENSMEAIITALALSQPGSYLLVFTDASPNDLYLLPTAISMATLTGSHLSVITFSREYFKMMFLLTGSCSKGLPLTKAGAHSDGFSKEVNPNEPLEDHSYSVPSAAPSTNDSGLAAYYDLAAVSGGHVFSVDKSEVGKVLELVKDYLMPIKIENGYSKVTVYAIDHQTELRSTLTIAIDSSTTDLIFTVTGANSAAELVFTGPEKLPSTSTPETVLELENLLMLRVPIPVAGLWRITFKAESKLSLRVTGKSSFGFAHSLIDEETGAKIEHPIKGSKMKVRIEALGRGAASHIYILALNGMTLNKSNLYQIPGSTNVYSTDSLEVPAEPFRIHLSGKDEKGSPAERMTPVAIIPVEKEIETNSTISPTPATPPPPPTKLTLSTGSTRSTITPRPRPPPRSDKTRCHTEFYGTCQMNDLPCPDGKYVDGLCRDPNNKGIKWIQREVYRSCCVRRSEVGY